MRDSRIESSVNVHAPADGGLYESSSIPRCWTPLFGYQRVLKRHDVHSIYGVDELHAILDLERRRARRTGKENSILSYRIDRFSGRTRATRRMVAALKEAVRETDQIGWLSDEMLAVLLSDTPVEAAEAIASRLSKTGVVPGGMSEVRSL